MHTNKESFQDPIIQLLGWADLRRLANTKMADKASTVKFLNGKSDFLESKFKQKY